MRNSAKITVAATLVLLAAAATAPEPPPTAFGRTLAAPTLATDPTICTASSSRQLRAGGVPLMRRRLHLRRPEGFRVYSCHVVAPRPPVAQPTHRRTYTPNREEAHASSGSCS